MAIDEIINTNEKNLQNDEITTRKECVLLEVSTVHKKAGLAITVLK